MVRMQEMLFLVMVIFSITSDAFNTICPSVCTCKWKNGELITTCSYLRFKFTLVIVPPPACFFNLVRSHALSSRQPWLLKAASSFYFQIGFDVNTSVLYFLRQVSLNIWRKRRLEQYFDLLIVLNKCIWFMSMQRLCILLLVLLVVKKCYVGSHRVLVFVV